MDYCLSNNIRFEKLDQPNNNLREKFLINSTGSCPDFWCKKETEELFIEIKTLTNLTNQKREQIMQNNIEHLRQAGLMSGSASPAFDPIPELKGPFLTFLKSASAKFKNIKPAVRHSRLLLIDGVIGDLRFITHAVFGGAFDSYKKELDQLKYSGLNKTQRGLFDLTGSNVSGVLYWNEEIERFCGIENYKALIPFPRSTFQTFFERKF